MDRTAELPATALVLAGRRPEGDPLAAAHGVSHKALIPVAGEPMIGRVLGAIEAAGVFGQIAICIDDPDAVKGVPAVEALRSQGRLQMLPAGRSPAASVIACLEQLGGAGLRGPGAGPTLVTTGDHPLLNGEILRDFWRQAREPAGADLAVGVVSESVVRARFPAVNRTFLPLKGMRVTGANLFAFLGPEALAFARFWLRAEAHRKRPLRLLAPFGPVTLLLFALRRLDLAAAFARGSRVVGAEVRPVALAHPGAALDVDREEHLALAQEILGGEDPAGSFTHPS